MASSFSPISPALVKTSASTRRKADCLGTRGLVTHVGLAGSVSTAVTPVSDVEEERTLPRIGPVWPTGIVALWCERHTRGAMPIVLAFIVRQPTSWFLVRARGHLSVANSPRPATISLLSQSSNPSPSKCVGFFIVHPISFLYIQFFLLVIMPSSSYDFIHNPSLPSDEDIVARCEEHKFPQGITITDPSTHSVIAWVKCGVNVTLGEAHMQHWTAMARREAGISSVQVASVFRAFTADYHGCRVGYITMQYIEGTDCDSKDVDLIARAVEALINLRAPSTATLGHFGSDKFYCTLILP